VGFPRQAGVAIVLVTATLWLQSAGMAVLIHWARASIDRGVKALSEWHSSLLMIRFTTAMIVLHILHILLWAAFYRWRCLPSWESNFYFSAASYSTVDYGDVVLPRFWRVLVAAGKRHGRAHVRYLGQCLVRYPHPPARKRNTVIERDQNGPPVSRGSTA
jgi:voltage-gated potassium channel